jgi:hypothetical protein
LGHAAKEDIDALSLETAHFAFGHCNGADYDRKNF